MAFLRTNHLKMNFMYCNTSNCNDIQVFEHTIFVLFSLPYWFSPEHYMYLHVQNLYKYVTMCIWLLYTNYTMSCTLEILKGKDD